MTFWKFLDKYNKNPSTSIKLAIGLLFAGISFILFTKATIDAELYSDSHAVLLWIVLGNFTLGIGELILSPTIYATITKVAPTNLKSTMTGLWFLFVAFGGYFSSIVAKLSGSSTTADSLETYNIEFIFLTGLLFAVALLVLLLSSKLEAKLN